MLKGQGFLLALLGYRPENIGAEVHLTMVPYEDLGQPCFPVMVPIITIN